MKKCLIVIISFLCAGEMFSQKDSYFPQVFFDKKQAESQLGYGKSTIEGVAFTFLRCFLTKNKQKLSWATANLP